MVIDNLSMQHTSVFRISRVYLKFRLYLFSFVSLQERFNSELEGEVNDSRSCCEAQHRMRKQSTAWLNVGMCDTVDDVLCFVTPTSSGFSNHNTTRYYYYVPCLNLRSGSNTCTPVPPL